MREFNITLGELKLRSTTQNKRNVSALVQSDGVFPFDGALGSLRAPMTVTIDGISPAPVWPWPQVFYLKQLILVATETQLYEHVSGVNVLKLDSLTAGIRWTFADFHRFIVGTNGKQLVYRDAETLTWVSGAPNGLENCTSVLNYKGQLLMTAYGATVPDNFADFLGPALDFSIRTNTQYLL